MLIVHEAPRQENESEALPAEALALHDELLAVASVRDAARVVAKTQGLPRDKVYAAALARSGSA